MSLQTDAITVPTLLLLIAVITIILLIGVFIAVIFYLNHVVRKQKEEIHQNWLSKQIDDRNKDLLIEINKVINAKKDINS